MFANTVPDPAHRLAVHAQPKSGLSSGYLAVWSAIGCLSALYIGQVAWSSIDAARPLSVRDAKAEGEATKLRQTLADLQRDLGNVRADLVRTSSDSALIATVSAIEERTSMVTGLAVAKIEPKAPAPAAIVPAAALPQAAAAADTAPDATTVATAAALKPAANEAIAAPPQPELTPITLAPQGLDKLVTPIETGSLALAAVKAGGLPKSRPGLAAPALATPGPAAAQAAPIAFGPAVVKSAPKPFAVQLASGTTLDAIKLSWSLLADQHADALRNLQPRYSASGTEQAGQTFDLVAGPVKTAADAKRICKALAARGTDCRIAPYQGDAF